MPWLRTALSESRQVCPSTLAACFAYGNLRPGQRLIENRSTSVSGILAALRKYPLRLWLNTILKAVSGTYFVLTSLYCLLAFLPYTFCAFIKTPPYAWMPWLAHHQAALYWSAIAASLISLWPWQKDKRTWIGIGLLFAAGVYLTLRPFLPGLENNSAAYAWSLIALLPLIGIGVWPSASAAGRRALQSDESSAKPFGFSAGLLVAVIVSVIYSIGARVRVYSDSHTLAFHWQDAAVAFWSLVSHLALAIVVLSTLNLVFLLAAKTSKPQAVRRGLVSALIMVVLSFVLARFLGNAMSFFGWSAYLYASALALTLTLWGFSMVEPFLARKSETMTVPSSASSAGYDSKLSSTQTVVTWIAMVMITLLALGSRSLIGGEDWNGFVESTSALLFWIAMSLCVYRLRPVRKLFRRGHRGRIDSRRFRLQRAAGHRDFLGQVRRLNR